LPEKATFRSARSSHKWFTLPLLKPMLSECFNPECRKKLEYLRNGRVIRTVRNASSQLSVEHFWLCGSCYSIFDFGFGPDGTVALRHKSRVAEESVTEITDVFVA
jgi:hypothetical protein